MVTFTISQSCDSSVMYKIMQITGQEVQFNVHAKHQNGICTIFRDLWSRHGRWCQAWVFPKLNPVCITFNNVLPVSMRVSYKDFQFPVTSRNHALGHVEDIWTGQLNGKVKAYVHVVMNTTSHQWKQVCIMQERKFLVVDKELWSLMCITMRKVLSCSRK